MPNSENQSRKLNVVQNYALVAAAVVVLVILLIVLIALGVFQYFYAERTSQYFGLTEFEYLHLWKLQITTAQLPAFGIAGGLVVVSLINAFCYEIYNIKHPQTDVTQAGVNPILSKVQGGIDGFLSHIKSLVGYTPNNSTWIAKIFLALTEAYCIYLALSVEKASNIVVEQLGFLFAIGLPLLTIIVSHGFVWVFFYVFNYNNCRLGVLNTEINELEQANQDIKKELGDILDNIENYKNEMAHIVENKIAGCNPNEKGAFSYLNIIFNAAVLLLIFLILMCFDVFHILMKVH